MNEKRSLSYSKLSSFDIYGPSVLIKRKILDNEGLRYGSVVDLLIVDKLLNKKNFEEKYLIIKYEKPKNNHALLAEDILQRFEEIPDEKIIIDIIKGLNLWSNIKNEALLLEKIHDEQFLGYLKESFICKEKIPITLEDYVMAKDDADMIINHKTTKEFFQTTDNTSIFLQVPFEKERGDFIYRGVIDLLKITEIDEDSIEVEILDIKTGTPKSDKFAESFYKYRYYLQSSLYQESVYDILKNVYDITGKKVIIKNFKFIYKCKTESFPIIWEVSEKWYEAGIKGFYSHKFYKYKGVDEIQDEIKFHFDNNLFEYSKEYYVNNGVVKLKDNHIELNDN